MRLLVLLLLAGCAGAPPGTRYANPNCIYRCVVEVVDASGALDLDTLNATQGATSTSSNTGGAKSKTTTTSTTTTE